MNAYKRDFLLNINSSTNKVSKQIHYEPIQTEPNHLPNIHNSIYSVSTILKQYQNQQRKTSVNKGGINNSQQQILLIKNKTFRNNNFPINSPVGIFSFRSPNQMNINSNRQKKNFGDKTFNHNPNFLKTNEVFNKGYLQGNERMLKLNPKKQLNITTGFLNTKSIKKNKLNLKSSLHRTMNNLNNTVGSERNELNGVPSSNKILNALNPSYMNPKLTKKNLEKESAHKLNKSIEDSCKHKRTKDTTFGNEKERNTHLRHKQNSNLIDKIETNELEENINKEEEKEENKVHLHNETGKEETKEVKISNLEQNIPIETHNEKEEKETKEDEDDLDYDPNWRKQYQILYDNFFPDQKKASEKKSEEVDEGELSYSEVLDIICKFDFKNEKKSKGEYIFKPNEIESFDKEKKSLFLKFFFNK
ncbi:MAG: hypothetical protein MJ252_07375 [archaeon]|nr:hypothetical protein [archaeon]